MINYLKSFAWSFGIIIVSTIIITLFNYFNILNGILLLIIKLLIPIIAIFIGGYNLGKVSNNKGYIEGTKYGLLWVIILLIINLTIKSLTWMTLIFLVVLLIISILSSKFGINKKK